MIPEIAQSVPDAARAGTSVLTGSFVLDGAILIAALKVIEAGINKIRTTRNGKRPTPMPGETSTCRLHGEDIATLKAFKDSATESLTRIESKVDRILERGNK